jgi:hypothetical protein
MMLVMGMDEDEWDEVRRGGVAAEVVEKLGRERYNKIPNPNIKQTNQKNSQMQIRKPNL